jgi:hypothetical protein
MLSLQNLPVTTCIHLLAPTAGYSSLTFVPTIGGGLTVHLGR